jgi:RHS repeat-associated protein
LPKGKTNREDVVVFETFGYDANGNITTSTKWTSTDYINKDYIYEPGTNRVKLVDRQHWAFDDTLKYDASGNVARHSGKRAGFSYDRYNMLSLTEVQGEAGIDSILYGYNVAGERVSKALIYHYLAPCDDDQPSKDGGEDGQPPILGDTLPKGPPGTVPIDCPHTDTVYTYYVRGQGQVLAEQFEDTAQTITTTGTYIFAGANRIAMRDSSYQLHYYLKDHLGSTRLVIDSSGVVKGNYWYYSYGANYGEVPDSAEQYRYTSKPLDPEAGLDIYYYGARYYDPELGRFLAMDPLASKYPGWSPYAYALDNPIGNIDPDGKVVETVVDVASIGLSAYDLYEEPSWTNLGWLALDIGAALVPFVPAAGVVRHADKLHDAAKWVGLVDEARDAAKLGGRLGGAKHRSVVRKYAQKMKDKGFKIEAGGGGSEKRVEIPKGGHKEHRYPDITLKAPDGTMQYINIGKTTKKGLPISREIKALEDLKSTGARSWFVPLDAK